MPRRLGLVRDGDVVCTRHDGIRMLVAGHCALRLRLCRLARHRSIHGRRVGDGGASSFCTCFSCFLCGASRSLAVALPCSPPTHASSPHVRCEVSDISRAPCTLPLWLSLCVCRCRSLRCPASLPPCLPSSLPPCLPGFCAPIPSCLLASLPPCLPASLCLWLHRHVSGTDPLSQSHSVAKETAATTLLIRSSSVWSRAPTARPRLPHHAPPPRTCA